jgi:acyl-ACP thioesterase
LPGIVADFDELVAAPATGRIFEQPLVPSLGDAAPSGRVRLDALACWLQDAAHADLVDAGLAGRALWVVRRARLCVHRFPRFDEPVRILTFCSALGRMWAQRRTTITTASGGWVEAVALWVHLGPDGRRPAPLRADELAAYSASTEGRTTRARLRHPAPPPDAQQRPWWFRASDLDVAGHVNNAVYWAALEEELAVGPEPERLDAELEHHAPAQRGPAVVLSHGARRWITTDDGVLRASAELRPAPSPAG